MEFMLSLISCLYHHAASPYYRNALSTFFVIEKLNEKWKKKEKKNPNNKEQNSDKASPFFFLF